MDHQITHLRKTFEHIKPGQTDKCNKDKQTKKKSFFRVAQEMASNLVLALDG